MKVNTKERNNALQSLITNPSTIVFLDANVIIPADRSLLNVKAFSFDFWRQNWLEPLFDCFDGLSLHESVLKELVDTAPLAFARDKELSGKLKIFLDSFLSKIEYNCYESYIQRLAIHSMYSPERDNAKDRGEILSLSYMATKGFLYFAANDDLPRRLIENAIELNTGLDDMHFLHSYDVIYYLYKTKRYDTKALRIIYKYMYYLTSNEKKHNPSWNEFIEQMDKLYPELL